MISANLGGLRPTELLINLVQETITPILQSDDLIRLELLHVVLVASLLCRMVALVHHVGVVDPG